jgi:Spy/CpxP family protein refolding chaperone
MFKRANKITALLVAAASVMATVPAMAADSTTSRLTSKDGHITNAVAFKDGKYAYQGYKSIDDTDSI